MTPSDNTLGYRLDNAPVRRVVLEVQFAASPPLQARHLWPFFSAVRDQYAEVLEGPPVSNGQKAELEIVPDGDYWPIPRTNFRNAHRDLFIQSDELALGWSFGDGDSAGRYVGFEALLAELQAVYIQLEDTLKAQDIDISPFHVSCFYANAVPEMSGSDLVAGVVSGWRSRQEGSLDNAANYVGLRMHENGSGESNRHEIVTMVDAEDGESPLLSFSVDTSVADEESPFQALEAAHECLIATFRSKTSDELRKGWGE